MNKEEFIKEVEKLGIKVTKKNLEQLEIYCEYLLEYNKHTNLTAIKTKEESLLDIGSGAGFPGMVLKIFFPNLKVYLVDSNNKKTKFLEELKIKLNVNNLEVINNRIEKLYDLFLNKIDIVTARAVTNLTILSELAIPIVKKDKYFIAMKGNATEEINESRYAI